MIEIAEFKSSDYYLKFRSPVIPLFCTKFVYLLVSANSSFLFESVDSEFALSLDKARMSTAC